MEFRKGQGATEYLVLLAVVLIIALVSIALLGFFPGLAGDARLTQSDSYWRGQARPFQVVEHTNTKVDNGTLEVVLLNSEANKLVISSMNFGGFTGGAGVELAGGEKKSFSLTGGNLSTSCIKTGAVYEILGSDITITYVTAENLTKVQGGANTKSLAGKCV